MNSQIPPELIEAVVKGLEGAQVHDPQTGKALTVNNTISTAILFAVVAVGSILWDLREDIVGLNLTQDHHERRLNHLVDKLETHIRDTDSRLRYLEKSGLVQAVGK